MKISIDYDGTMWSHMAFFRALMQAMRAQGHQVGILTGHTSDGEPQDVQLMLARGFPKPDFWFGRTPEYHHLNGSYFKADVILKENIDLHFDDCDFGNPESSRILDEKLGPLAYKVIRMRWREPSNVHYE